MPVKYSLIHTEMKRTFDYIRLMSEARSDRWLAETPPWSVLEWAGAMCGEAGEAANVAKKIKRTETKISNGPSAGTIPDLEKDLARECADTFLYLVLLASSRRIDLAQAIIDTFNNKSAEHGFPERL